MSEEIKKEEKTEAKEESVEEEKILEESNSENKDKKKQHMIIAGIVGLVAFVGVGGYFLLQNNNAELKVKKDMTYELGEQVILKPDYFVEDMNENVVKEIQLTSELLKDDTKYKVDEKTLEVVTKGKKVLDVGSYDVTLALKEDSKKVPFKVEDTKAPVFKNFLKEINIEKDAENVDLKKYFKVEDFSDFTLTIEQGEFDVTKAGSYKIKVIAKDKYNNEVTKETTVNVLSSEEAKKEGLSKTTDGKMAVSKETQNKIDKGEINVEESKPQTESKPSTNTEDKKPSKPSGGNTGSTEKPKPNHTHKWVEQFKTIHHDAVYENKYVVDQPAWDEQVPRYEMREHSICNDCGADITGFASDHILNGTCRRYHSEWIQEVVGYDTVHHPEQGHNEQVLVKEAWDEKVSNGFKCSCGATK